MNSLLKYANRTFSNWGLRCRPWGYLYFGAMHAADRLLTRLYCYQKLSSVYHSNCTINLLHQPNIIDLVTIAFNNEITIEWQIKLLRKNLRDQCSYTVADNSPSPEAREKIKNVCENYGVGYIQLPHNPYSGRFANFSHGLALNWTYKNFLLPRKAVYFGFLDHDIFPIRPTSIINELIKHSMYAAIHIRKKVWYTWPGFSFYQSNFFTGRQPNFSSAALLTPWSGTFLDTGGGNWKNIFSKTDIHAIKKATYRYGTLENNGQPHAIPYRLLPEDATVRTDSDAGGGTVSDTLIEFVDDWLHIRRVSYGNTTDVKRKLTEILQFFT